MRSNQKQPILIYTQDPGGASFLAPLIKKLICNHTCLLGCHPISETKLINYGLKPQIIGEKWRLQDWNLFLEKVRPSIIVCTLSSKLLDLSNGHLIEASRTKRIPSIGFFDHWKGVDRICDRQDKPTYATDIIGVIDQGQKIELSDYIEPSRISIVGHVVLEKLLEESLAKPISIGFISQPNTLTLEFDSLFFEYLTEDNIFSTVSNFFNHQGIESRLYFFPHPKESGKFHKLLNKKLVQGRSVKNIDIFIGFDSIRLIEEALKNKYVLFLKTHTADPMSKILERFGIFEFNTNSLRQFILKEKLSLRKEFEGSLARCEELIEFMISQGLKLPNFSLAF